MSESTPPSENPLEPLVTGSADGESVNDALPVQGDHLPAQPRPRRRRTALVIGAAVALLAVAALAGIAIGHAMWPSRSALAVHMPSSSNLPYGAGSSGSGSASSGSGYGYGYGYGYPSGSGSSGSSSPTSGNSSTAFGSPANITSIAAAVDPGLVDINVTLNYGSEQAAGTGMVLTPSGEVLTNNHVIDGATAISVTDIGNGKTYTATVVGYDRAQDVAVLQLQGASGLSTVSIGNSAQVATGTPVVSIGNAGGTGGTPSTAGGSVTALNQSITAGDVGGGDTERLSGLIEVNADVQPGDSGGPTVTSAGQVIGMNTAVSQSVGFQSTGYQGYIIPINTAVALSRQIEAGAGSATVHIGRTGFLGVEIQSSGSSSFFGQGNGTAGGSSTSGVVLGGVVNGTPAQKAGLVAGDVITALNGQTVGSGSALIDLLVPYHPGNTVQLRWIDQSGQTHNSQLTLASGPPA